MLGTLPWTIQLAWVVVAVVAVDGDGGRVVDAARVRWGVVGDGRVGDGRVGGGLAATTKARVVVPLVG